MTRELLEWFPCQKASTCHKNSRLGSIACSTQWCNKGAQFHGGRKSQQCQKYFFQYSTLACKRPQVWTQGHQACFLPRAPSNLVMPSWQHGSQSSPNPRTRVRPTIVSYCVCHVLSKHNEPFEESDILKEAFIEAANGLFENFISKTWIVKVIKCKSPNASTMSGNSYVCGGATEEGYWHMWVLSPPIWRDDLYGDVEQLCVFIRMGFKDMSAKEELLTILPLKGHTRCEIEDIFNAFVVGLVNETKLLLFNWCFFFVQICFLTYENHQVQVQIING